MFEKQIIFHLILLLHENTINILLGIWDKFKELIGKYFVEFIK